MAAGMPIDYFVESVFNYPTLAECYKVAALDGISRLRPMRENVEIDKPGGRRTAAGRVIAEVATRRAFGRPGSTRSGS